MMEIWLIALTPLILWSVPATLQNVPLMRLILFIFVIASAILIASTVVASHAHTKAAIYQFAYNFKWPLMLLLGFRLSWQVADHARLYKFIWIYVLVVFAFVALDVVSPSLYQAINRNATEYHHTSNPLLAGQYYRLSGPFIHSSVLAYYSAMFIVLIAVQRAAGLNKGLSGLLLIGCLAMSLACSGQMQETAAALAISALVFAAFRVKSIWTMAGLLGTLFLVVACAFVGVVGPERLMSLAYEWGFSQGVHAITSARPILYSDSFALANEHFPLGTGLGTFAGAGAMKLNRELYDSLGYISFWWYKKDRFLMDTYWPNFIAEGGWIVAFLLFMVPVLLAIYSMSRLISSSNPELKAVWAYASG
ncbi:MAG: hypothetical protein EOO38_28325, partial [Cytophagaceae bacterium]